MSKQAHLLLVVAVLGLMDAVVPLVPILALVLIYVILDKPSWFLATVRELYNTKLDRE